MSKSKFQTVYAVKIYPIDYLCNNELTESDLNNLLDNNKKGLMYSLIIGMFRYIKNDKRNFQIIKIIKADNNWPYKYQWTKNQRDEYENLVIKIIKNIYQYKDSQAISIAQWFMMLYGFSVIGNNFRLDK